MSVKIGEWVTMYEPGIWRVVRVIDTPGDVEPIAPNPVPARHIYAARFLTAKGKPSFRTASCHEIFAAPLDRDTRELLETYISKHPDTFRAFERYDPRLPDLRYHLGLSAPATDIVFPEEFLARLSNGLSLPVIVE